MTEEVLAGHTTCINKTSGRNYSHYRKTLIVIYMRLFSAVPLSHSDEHFIMVHSLTFIISFYLVYSLPLFIVLSGVEAG